MTRRAMLLKVQIQTTWVEVDDESGYALEHINPPVVIPGAQWAKFYDNWYADWQKLQDQVAAAGIDTEKVLTNGSQG